MKLTVSELEEIIAKILEGRATLECPCGFITTQRTSWKEIKKHIRHILQWGRGKTKYDPEKDKIQLKKITNMNPGSKIKKCRAHNKELIYCEDCIKPLKTMEIIRVLRLDPKLQDIVYKEAIKELK